MSQMTDAKNLDESLVENPPVGGFDRGAIAMGALFLAYTLLTFNVPVPAPVSQVSQAAHENPAAQAAPVQAPVAKPPLVLPDMTGTWKGSFTIDADDSVHPGHYWGNLKLWKAEDGFYKGVYFHHLNNAYHHDDGSATYKVDTGIRGNFFEVREVQMAHGSVNSDDETRMYLTPSADGKTLSGKWAYDLSPNEMAGTVTFHRN